LPRPGLNLRRRCFAATAVVAVVVDEPKPTILVAEKLGEGGVEMLKQVGTVDCSYDLTKDELLAKISLVDAIVIRSATKASHSSACALSFSVVLHPCFRDPNALNVLTWAIVLPRDMAGVGPRHSSISPMTSRVALCVDNMQPARCLAHDPLSLLPVLLQVTREVFEASKGRLKVVGRAGVGIDNVDLAAASETGCLGACVQGLGDGCGQLRSSS
jgi:D-3-phosphoglycerate dehydrogenase